METEAKSNDKCMLPKKFFFTYFFFNFAAKFKNHFL